MGENVTGLDGTKSLVLQPQKSVEIISVNLSVMVWCFFDMAKGDFLIYLTERKGAVAISGILSL